MMKRPLTILILLFLCCTGCDKEREGFFKWNITLDHTDKRPYGTYLAYESLKYYFPGASNRELSRGFRYNYMDNKMRFPNVGHNLLVLEGVDFYLSDKEWAALKDFIKSGNEVVLFSAQIDPKISDELNCYEQEYAGENAFDQFAVLDSSRSVLSLASDVLRKYGYRGRSLKGYFASREIKTDTSGPTNSDSSSALEAPDTDAYSNGPTDSTASAPPAVAPGQGIVTIPGYTNTSVFNTPVALGYAGEKPDFVRYSLVYGHLTLHAAPLALSNYFLLQDGNKDYLTGIWQTLPENITGVYWNEYLYRHGTSSGFDVLWRFSATKLAIWLAIFALLMYIVFEMKRKQRIIPIIPPMKNDSVSFVETVGRLYYNKGNHTNLAEKMVQQYLEWVRNHYFLNTNLIDEHFIKQLIIKSGQPETTVRALTDMIMEIKTGAAKTDDAYLYQLYNTIQTFYKNHPR